VIRVIISFIILVVSVSYLIGGAIGFFEYDLFSLFKKDEWIGFFYPNKEDSKTFTQSPVSNNLDDCRKWVDNTKRQFNLIEGTYKFECGKNCIINSESNSYKCEETTK